MEKANTLNQMKQYDFRAPINITMIFEETEDECVQNISETQFIKDRFKEAEVEAIDNNNETLNGKLKTHSLIMREKLTHSNDTIRLSKSITSLHEDDDRENHFTDIQRPVTQNKCISEASDNIRNIISTEQQRSNDIETLDEKQLLDIVSDNLILLMRLYYYYYNEKCKNDSGTITELTKQLDTLKVHFFDLSYSTVVTLILPQENNEIFVANFLNKTVDKANKAMQCNFVRKDIEPFYKDMIVWIKKKRDHLRLFGSRLPAKTKHVERNRNENRLLKEYLAYPLLSTDSSQQSCIPLRSPPKSAPLQKTGTELAITEDSTYSRESIMNISPNSLRAGYQEMPTLKERPIYYNQSVNQVQQNCYYQRTTICNNSAPPYNANHNIVSKVNLPSYQSIARSTQNYEITQSVYDNTNCGNMQYTQSVGNGATMTPIITNVTSLNPSHTTHPFGPCCICGKSTSSRCSKCYDYSYCSTLCQAIDSGTHKTACRGFRGNSSYL